MAFGIHGLVNRADHVLVGAWNFRHVFQVFGNGFARDGHAIAVQQAGCQQGFHDLGDTARLVQVHGQVLAARLQVANDGDFLAHALEIINRPLDASRVGNGQKVQHRVGGAARGHDHSHSVFDGFLGDDVAGLEVFFDGFDQDLGGLFGRVLRFIMGVGHGGRVGQGHAQSLKRRGHGVGGVHATARTRARNCPLFNFLEVKVAEFARSVFTYRFEHADDVQVFTLVAAWQDGAAVDVNGGHVGAQHAHHAAGHVFVAATDDQNAIHPLTTDAGFNAV